MSYLFIAWPGEAPVWLADLMRALPDDWSIAQREARLLVAVGGTCPPQVRSGADAIIIGERQGAAPHRGGQTPNEAARKLCTHGWGDYVALLGQAPGPWSVFRSPSGGRDALAWCFGEAMLVAGDLPAWLDRWAPVSISIDWDAVAAILADPALASGEVALSGAKAIAPGALWSQRLGSQAIWSPGEAARCKGLDRKSARARMRQVVDEVVQAQAGARTLIELSGGLDSAIVASALRGRDVLAVNYYSRELGGDERAFAREVARALGLELLEVEKPPPFFNLAALEEIAGGSRPALGALDFEHDRDMAERCRAEGAEALLTGQGGDHVFFQAPSPLIAADALPWRLGPQALAVVAGRTGRSSWSVLREAVGARLGGGNAKFRPPHASQHAWAIATARSAHPWLGDLAGLPPAKTLQAACLAAALSLNGASRRGAAARLRHPLLSQPVMELCLPLHILDLTQGGHDRALAREAFAERLPVGVIERRGKGRLTSHYGRMIASGLTELRPLLLEGRLAAEGLLDRNALDQMLTLEHLAWRGGYGAIMTTTALELWVRSWEARLRARL